MIFRRRSLPAWIALALLAACAAGTTSCSDDLPEAAAKTRLHAHWKPARSGRADVALSESQRAEIEALQAIGYAAGVNAAGELQGVVRHDEARSQAGLNLYTSGHAAEARLVDARGQLVHRWARRFEDIWPDRAVHAGATHTQFWRRVALDAEGNLFAIFEGLGLVKLDLRSRVVWAKTLRAHHDLELQRDGTLLVLTREAHVIPRVDPERPLLEDFVTLLDAQGEELWSVSLLEAFENSRFAEMFEKRRLKFQAKQAAAEGKPQQQPAGDIFHTNTLERFDGRHASSSPIFKAGNVLLSLRNVHLLAVLNPISQKIVWARGGSWRDQHQPSLLPSGNLLVFNNRAGDRRSEALEIDPLNGEVVWSFSEPEPDQFFSAASGSCARLRNGNTLITESNAGRAFEVTASGEIVWDFRSPHRAGEQDQWVANLFEVLRLPPGDERLTWLAGGRGDR